MESKPDATDKVAKDPGRRNFLNVLLGGAIAALAGAIIYPVLRFISPPKIAEAATNTVKACTRSELKETGSKIFPFGSEPAIVIEAENGELLAYSAVCTHLACTVQYRKDKKAIWCACHNGWYDLRGETISGPPPRPLPSYSVDVRGEDIYVTRS